jgi:type IV pilus assembly protein PilB
MNIGVAPYNIAAAVQLIIAQRLARRLCSHCKTLDTTIPKEVLLREGFREEEIPALKIYKPVGCDQCSGGYKGRVGIYQVLKLSEAMQKVIMKGGNAIDLADQARREGIPDLRESGLKKLKAGMFGLEELNRVTKE